MVNPNPRKTKAKRKLLSPKILQELREMRKLGVPLQALIRHKKLDISRPVVVNLLKCYNAKTPQVERSLFPTWLDLEKTEPQVNPDEWYYVGRFPFGEWCYDADD